MADHAPAFDLFDDDAADDAGADRATRGRAAGPTDREPQRDRSHCGGPADAEPPRRHPGGRCCTKDAPCLVHGLAMRA